ncbi:hypothetical protein [Sulfurovum sp. NBC37-1]|uniref:hypothetical protein n=1 Tax=Sulfurovum sp. (strain NBC37-1) TaxID=387093 RepID=UPI00015879B2|nr:hypothetical protein [Sulfurovum sp. NBC37-1]BAF72964.1 hypothetical protein SUN_2022 [Sulfurovum sp. NBC37-1]
MKQIKTIFITLLLTLSANAGWKPLKSLEHYGSKAFTLKKGVVYVELRKYSKTTEMSRLPTVTKNTSVALRIYQSAPRNMNVFSRIPLKEQYAIKKGKYVGLGGSSSWYYNGFMLDSKRKTWRLENIMDVVDMVKPIDTPAELSLVLWLNSDAGEKAEKYSAKYRKSGSGYVVREHHVSHEYNGWKYACGEYIFEYKINVSGKITQKKLIKKRKFKVCGGRVMCSYKNKFEEKI